MPDFDFNQSSPDTAAHEVFMGAYEIDLTDKLNLLKSTLENDRPADAISHTFTFRRESLDDIYLPDQVRNLEKRHGQLNSVILVCCNLKDCGGISFEMRMEFCEPGKSSTWLSVVRPYSNQSHAGNSDLVTPLGINNSVEGGGSYEIKAFTRQQFNRCLGSIVYNSPRINQSVFDDYDWHANDYMVMTDNFQSVADTAWCNYEYFLDNYEGGYAGSLNYFKLEDEVTEIRLSRVTMQDVYMQGRENMHYREKTVEISASLNRSGVHLFEHNYKDGYSSTHVTEPDESDYRAFFDFIDWQMDDVQQIQVEVFDDDTTQPFED